METAQSRANDPRDKPFSEIDWLAIFVSEPRKEQRHLGVLYRHEGTPGGVVLLHLAWHHDLRAHAPSPECLWVQPDIEPEARRALSQLCVVLAEKYSKKRRSIAYALRYEDGHFDAGGALVTERGRGLTCATFVLALFASYGVSLLRTEEWMSERDEERLATDTAWQTHVVSELRKGLASKRDIVEGAELAAHIVAVEADELGCARFRPEEVAAAGTSPELPASFAYAAPVGVLIVEKLRQRAAR